MTIDYTKIIMHLDKCCFRSLVVAKLFSQN